MSDWLDNQLTGVAPSRIVAGSAIATVLGLAAIRILRDPKGFLKAVIGLFVKAARSIPASAKMIDKEVKKNLANIEKGLVKYDPNQLTALPELGWTEEKIVALMDELHAKDKSKWSSGKVSGCVYYGVEEHTRLMTAAFGMYALSNPLHLDVFPSVRKFELEVIKMTATMLNGGPTVCGAMTSGGTESILMAVRAYRNYYRKIWPHVTQPEVIVSRSVHVAFCKATDYLNMKLVVVDDGPDYRANVNAIRKHITDNTILIVGSAPSFPHGLIDPIEQLAALAHERGIGFHVDCCLGGFILPWLKRLGHDIPAFDFSVEGVTSISADTHKYGFSVKGTSVVLFRTPELRQGMYFLTTEWPGGVYASPTLAGSRPGALIAATWASLVHLGENGYLEAARGISNVFHKLKEGIPKIEGLYLIGDPKAMIIAFGSDDNKVDIFAVNEAMSKKGWHLNALQFPSSLHICICYPLVGHADDLLNDLRDSVEAVRLNPSKFYTGLAPAYGLAANDLIDRSILNEVIVGTLDIMGTQQISAPPDQQPPTNENH